jgi:hypothetical protein
MATTLDQFPTARCRFCTNGPVPHVRGFDKLSPRTACSGETSSQLRTNGHFRGRA